MANTFPAIVIITATSIGGASVTKTFNAVKEINYNFFENTINIVAASGSFYFGYASIATVTHVITNGVTTITIS